MLPVQFKSGKKLKILCLGAHCDDIEIGCGASIMKLQNDYDIEEVKWIVFASNPVRKKEATACAKLFLEEIRKKDITILNFRDGFLPFSPVEIKEYFEEIKNQFTPDIIFTHFRNDRHQDHRMISDLTWNTWRDHFILEYEIPKYDGDLGVPNFFVGLERHHLEKKIEFLLKAFESQRDKHWFDEETFKALPRLRGMESASRYAEAFYVRKTFIN